MRSFYTTRRMSEANFSKQWKVEAWMETLIEEARRIPEKAELFVTVHHDRNGTAEVTDVKSVSRNRE